MLDLGARSSGPPRRPLLFEYAEVLLVSVLLAVYARSFLVQAFEIPTGSMEASLLVGDHIMVNRFVFASSPTALERALLPQRHVTRGDIVVFRYPADPSQDLIKRCIGVGGDQIEIVDKVVVVNGKPLVEPYAVHLDPNVYPSSRFLHESLRYRDNLSPRTVPPGHLFCLGDNRDLSHDSRFWGTVPEDQVRGRALLIYWSERPDGDPTSTAATLDGSQASSASSQGGRWRRTLRLVR